MKISRTFWMQSALLAAMLSVMTIGCSSIERKLLFFPTHHSYDNDDNDLTPWSSNGEIIGYSRKVKSPKNVWLLLHGNAGQASDREYATPCFSPEDSVFVLEYPGYGTRKGVPSKKAFDLAAKEAYLLLRQTYPNVPVCVAGESIGTGPASSLAELERPPDKLVLLVAFDRLSRVAAEHVPSFLVKLLLTDDWDNTKALSNYIGQVEIYGALADSIIPVNRAMALAAAVPESKLVIIEGGHNDWSQQGEVKIRNP